MLLSEEIRNLGRDAGDWGFDDIADKTERLESINAELVEALASLVLINADLMAALTRYLNIPVLPEPGHEQELIGAINNAQSALEKARTQ